MLETVLRRSAPDFEWLDVDRARRRTNWPDSPSRTGSTRCR